MNIKAIITTLVLGSSSAALADTYTQPAPAPYSPYAQTPYSQDPYVQAPYSQAPYAGDHYDQDARRGWRRPMVLADNVQLSGLAQRPTFVRFDRLGNARTIRFDLQFGRASIDTVIVTFADGHRQTMRVGQMLSRRNPSITLELPHGGVTGMFIYGSSMRGRGMFDIVAVRGGGSHY